MNRRMIMTCMLTLVASASFNAQQLKTCEYTTSPPRAIDRSGNVSSEYLNWDATQGSCALAVVAPAAEGAVSVQFLSHKPPKNARGEFDRGMHALRKGRDEEALAHLAEAARLDPNFMEAEGQQGVVYARMSEPRMALDHFQRALALNPASHVLWSNKAAALIMLSRPAEAEDASRSAVKLAPLSTQGNYLLGLALLMQGKITREAADHLAMGAAKYPRARALLAELRGYLTPSEN